MGLHGAFGRLAKPETSEVDVAELPSKPEESNIVEFSFLRPDGTGIIIRHSGEKSVSDLLGPELAASIRWWAQGCRLNHGSGE